MGKVEGALLAGAIAALCLVAAAACSSLAEWTRTGLVESRLDNMLFEASGQRKTGRYEGARAILNAALALEPTNPRVLTELGDVHFVSGQYADAAACFEQVHDLAANTPGILARLGNAYMNLGQYDKAVQAWREAFEQAPGVLVPPYREMGRAYLAKGDPAAALEVLREGITKRPADLRTYYTSLLKAKQAELAGKSERAVEHARVTAILDQGISQEDLDKYDAAPVLQTFDREQTSRLHFEAGHICSLSPDTTREAIAHYTQAIAMDPGYGQAYHNRALMYFRLEEYAKAWDDAECAAQFGYPLDPAVMTALAQALQSRKGLGAPTSHGRPTHEAHIPGRL